MSEAIKQSLQNLCQDFSMEVTPADLPDPAELKHIITTTRCPSIRLFISHLLNDDIKQSLAIAEQASAASLQPVPHIVARRYQDLAEVIQTLRQFCACANIREILILGGDVPTPAGEIHDSLALLDSDIFTSSLVELGVQRVWFGVYPEGHATIDATVLQTAMQQKCAYSTKTGIPVRFITQLTFTADPLLDWLKTLSPTMPPIHPSVFSTGQYANLAYLARLTQTPSAQQFLHDTTDDIVCYHPQLCRVAATKPPLGGLHFLSFGKFAQTMAFARQLQQGKFHIDGQNLFIMTD